MLIPAAASIALPPVPVLVPAALLLLGLLASLVVLGRRRRAATVPAGEDAERLQAVGADDEGSPDDTRAMRLLVRTLETAIEELNADLVRMMDDQAELAAPAVPADPGAAPGRPDVAAERHIHVLSEALKGADEADLAARLSAALVRSGAPRAFVRPALAACIDVEMPVVRRIGDPQVSGESPGEVEGPDGPLEDSVLAPEPLEAPAEPERVLPVPAPAAPVPAARRGLFRRRVA